MKLLKELPKDLFHNIHQQALASMSKHALSAYTVGIHTVRMNINGIIKETIIPALSVSIPKITKKGVQSSNIDYRMNINGQPLPFAHIYAGSGHLCLGNIPVPPYISPYNLMAPLEILFLYNDRNSSHGGAHITLTPEQERQLDSYCNENNLEKISDSYVENDVIWDLCAQLLEQNDKEIAYKKAEKLFEIVFK